MVTRWEKRDNKRSAKKRIKQQGKDFTLNEEAPKKKRKKRKNNNDDYYEYINEQDY